LNKHKTDEDNNIKPLHCAGHRPVHIAEDAHPMVVDGQESRDESSDDDLSADDLPLGASSPSPDCSFSGEQINPVTYELLK
jgi:hypothetical protein